MELVPKDMLCPVLGIPLVFGVPKNANTLSFDRLIPKLGYVRGNVCVISYRANTLKNNCIDPNELRLVAEYLEKALRKSTLAA